MSLWMKATEQYFPVVLFITLYRVVLTFESVNEILKCDRSDERWLVSSTSCRTFYNAVHAVLSFEAVDGLSDSATILE